MASLTFRGGLAATCWSPESPPSTSMTQSFLEASFLEPTFLEASLLVSSFLEPSLLAVTAVLSPARHRERTIPHHIYHLTFTDLLLLLTIDLVVVFDIVFGVDLGFLPLFHGSGKMSFGGLTTQSEMFVLAFYFGEIIVCLSRGPGLSLISAFVLQGSVYGAFQSYARAFYAELIPPGEEARWYALFSITDKVHPCSPYLELS